MKKILIISAVSLAVAGAVIFLDSCKKTDVTFRPASPLQFLTPAGFPAPVYNFAANPISEEGFLLGRRLFYDGRLSKDGNFSCASCHQQVAAFTTFEHDRSHGYNHSHTLRNAPGLANLAWFPSYRQDGSATSLEAVSLAHILAPTEMAETMGSIISKLRTDTGYQRLFKAAYGSTEINSDRILGALSQFVINLVSANSKYDRVKRGEANFTPEEQQGYVAFQAKCSSCHKEPLFTDFTFRNNGLEIDQTLMDFGRMRVTSNRADSLKFRVPSLRNVELTSYYGHDGRYSIFRMMIQHYRDGINQGPTLDPALQAGIPISPTEENNLVAFLRTLSDSSYLTNPRFKE